MYKIAMVLNDTIQAIYTHEELPDYLADPRFTELTGANLNAQVGYVKVGSFFVAPEPTIIPPPYYGTKITKFAFLNRLGDTALAAIEAASRTNTSEGIAAAVMKIKIQALTYVDLSLPETSADLQKLVTYNFIGSAQATSILNDPVEAKEVPIFM